MGNIAQRDALVAKLAFRTTKRLVQRVKIEAAKRETSVQNLCTEAIEKHLDSLRPKKNDVAA
jgi:hypothetical protein